jgi:hypothetical protein
MEVIGFLIAAISLFAVNRLGFISRHSFFWKPISLIAVLIIDLIISWFSYTQSDKPFKLIVNIDKYGQITKVKINKSAITISLHGGQIRSDSLFFFDTKNREYYATLSKPYTNSSIEIDLLPKLPLLGHSDYSWKGGIEVYWIRPIGKRWIVLTNLLDFLILIFLLPGSFLLWYGGTKGKDPPELKG